MRRTGSCGLEQGQEETSSDNGAKRAGSIKCGECLD